MRIFTLVFAGIIVFVLGGCATSYNAIHPRNLYYAGSTNHDGVDFAYQYNVLKQAGNRKYAKKEDKKGLHVVAIKITNRTGQPLSFREDISVLAGDVPVGLMEPEIVARQVKQSVGVYSLYFLLSFMTLNTYNEYGQVNSSTPIGLIIGPPIAVGNMIAAGSANKNFKKELLANNLLYRNIADGETVYGLITIPENGYRPLSIKVNTRIDRSTGY